jgi:NADPH:quinone reductase-like Zn-dependent oxidoreductase
MALKRRIMKAVRIHQYGGPSVLLFEEAPMPLCGPEDVLIRVVGSSVNPVDCMVREGKMQAMLTYPMPLVPGWDVSGIVYAVGAQSGRFKVGDAVYSRPDIARDGTYAEFVAVHEADVALKPRTVSHIEAGVLPLAGITAWEAIVTAGKVQPGQRVLIHAAAGGVGSLAVQIAKAHGAHVIGTGSAERRALVMSLGADEFIDYRTQRLQDAVRDVDLVLDTMGGDTQEASWHVMAAGGLLVSIVSDPKHGITPWPKLRGAFLFIQPSAAVLKQLAEMVDGGKLRPVICAEFALHDIQKAHALSETHHAAGKIALYVGQP